MNGLQSAPHRSGRAGTGARVCLVLLHLVRLERMSKLAGKRHMRPHLVSEGCVSENVPQEQSLYPDAVSRKKGVAPITGMSQRRERSG